MVSQSSAVLMICNLESRSRSRLSYILTIIPAAEKIDSEQRSM